MRAGRSQPRPPGAVDRELHPRAPAEPALVTRHRQHLDRAVDAGESPQLFGHDCTFEPALGGQVDVLPVASAAPARAGVAAYRIHAVRRRGEDLDGVGPQEAVLSASFGHPRACLLYTSTPALGGAR